jgi:formylmethanofuran dehydrogenase subunit D
MTIISSIKNIFMPRAKKVKVVVEEATVSTGPLGFKETTGEKLTKESFIAYIENMKANEPTKYAKKKGELEKKLAELSE